MSRVLITGATGFIGRNLVARLAERGDDVRCLVRSPKQKGFFGPLKVDYALGNILDRGSLDAALQGIEVVYHLAGATLVVSAKEYALGNVTGNANLAAACARADSPPVVVFASSLAVAGPTPDRKPLTEAHPCRPASEYGRTKLLGEREYRAVAGRVPVTILRPSCVFGPWDLNTLWLFRTVRSRMNFVPGPGNLRLSWVHVHDLVNALMLAAERGQRLPSPSEGVSQEQGVYFVAIEEGATLDEVGQLAALTLGKRLWRTFHLPGPLCRLFARANDLRAWVQRRPILLSSDKIREGLAGSWLCSVEKARREMGFACRVSLAEGLQQTAEWYRAMGWL